MTMVVTEEVTRVEITDIQDHTKIDTVQVTVSVPTLVLRTVVSLRVQIKGPHSRVIVYPTTTTTYTTLQVTP